jgi:LuxR family quorum sensing-dependent transcriptional regulator
MIRYLGVGGVWNSPIPPPLIDRAPSVRQNLSRREIDCVGRVAHGLTDEEIAVELGISHATVRFHLDSARRKLVARSRTHLAALAVSRGLVTV